MSSLAHDLYIAMDTHQVQSQSTQELAKTRQRLAVWLEQSLPHLLDRSIVFSHHPGCRAWSRRWPFSLYWCASLRARGRQVTIAIQQWITIQGVALGRLLAWKVGALWRWRGVHVSRRNRVGCRHWRGRDPLLRRDGYGLCLCSTSHAT